MRDAGIIFHVFDTIKFWAKGIEYQIQEGDTGDAWFIGCAADVRANKVMPRFHPKEKTATVGKSLVNNAHIARSYFWEKPGCNLVEIIVKEDPGVYIYDINVLLIDGTEQRVTSSVTLLP